MREREYTEYERMRSRHRNETAGEAETGFKLTVLKQMIVCVILFLSVLYIKYSNDENTNILKVYTNKILTTDMNINEIYRNTSEFFIGMFGEKADLQKDEANADDTKVIEGEGDAQTVQ